MSAFSKLKYYARKPVAVIMAASLVTSTVPAVSLVAAAPVYAQQKAGGGHEVATEDEQTSNGTFDQNTGTIQLMFDSVSSKAGSVEITHEQIVDLLKAQKADEFAQYFDYNGESGAQFKAAVDEKIEELKKDKPGTYEVKDTAYSITDIEFTVAAQEGSNIKVDTADDGTVTVSTSTAATDEPLTITVTSISYQFDFKYAFTPEAAPEPEPEEPENPGESGETTGETPGQGSGGDQGSGDQEETQPAEPETTEAWFGGKDDASFTDKASGKIDLEAAPLAYDDVLTVTAEDYWADATDSATTVDAQGELVYQGDPIQCTVLNRQPGNLDLTVDLGDAENYIDVSVERGNRTGLFFKKYDYIVTITPKHASEAPLSFRINVKSRKGNYTITVNVPQVQPKQVDLATITTDAIDFRMADEQADDIVEAANAAVEKETGVKNLFATAEITDKDVYYGAALNGMTLDASSYTMTVNEDAEGASDYDFTTSTTGEDGTVTTTQTLPMVPVNKMQTIAWGEDGSGNLSLTAETLGGEKTLTAPDSGTWFRTEASTAWKDGELVQTTAETPSDGLEFSEKSTLAASGQGAQEGTFFVQDSGTQVVKKITGVTYQYDNIAPGLTALNAKAGSREFKSSDGEIWASEKMDVEFMTNEGASDDTKSGIDSVSASYSQKGSSEETEVKDIDYDTSNGVTTYSFSIDEDSEVSTESIKIDLQDKAGNERNDQGIHDTTTNIDVAKLVAEASAPTINASWDSSDAQNGRYYNHNRSLTLTVNAPFFEYTQEYLGNHAMATITKDGAAWKTVTPGDFTKTGDDTWSCTISFTEDGDYEVSNVNATDVLGRTSTAAGDTFTIDKTTPTMQVSFDNNNVANGKYYNAARTATITITEHNFDPSLVHITPTAGAGNGGEVGQPSISGWSTSGDVHTATVTFPGQGVYTLSVDGMDLATNELTPYTCPEFVVDTLTPEITISGVENMTAYQGDVNPSVAVHDTNLDSATDIHVQVVGTSPYGEEANPFTNDPSITATDASVSYRNPSDVKANDNVYTVVVNAVDLAGNTSDDAVTFSVNRFGSTYVISDETGKMLNEYLKFDDTTDVRVTEINPSGLDASQTAVELTRDTSNTTLSADDYTVEQGSASGWQEYVYTVNRDNYDTDGVYRVLFHSQDRAGNVSENEMEGKNAADDGASAQINFAVDDTAPLASFVDLSNTEPYNESSHVAKVTFEDNLMLDHAVVEINGEEVATFDAEQLAQSATQEFTINESTGNQSVRVTVYDAAGNEGEAVMDNVVVTTNAFELWRRNTPLFAGTIAVAVLAAAGVIFVVAKKRSKDGEAEA